MRNPSRGNPSPLYAIKSRFLSQTKIKYGTMMLILISIAFVLFVAVNILFEVLQVQYGLQRDMTTQKLYTMNDEAKAYVEALNKPVTLTIVQQEASFDVRTIAALKNYAALSSDITLQYVDLDLNPSFANAFQNEEITNSSIIVQCDDRYQVLDEDDLFYFGSASSVGERKILGLKTDQILCSALAFVTSDEQQSVAVSGGHGEVLPAEFESILDAVNREMETIVLETQDFSESSDLVVIAEPQTDFTSAEIKKLDDFLLSGNKNLLVFLDAQVGELPELEKYLGEWGLELQNNIIMDAEHYWNGNETFLFAGYDSDSEVGKTALENKLNLVLPLSRAIVLNGTQNELSGCEQFAVLKSFDSAYAKQITGSLSDAIHSIDQAAEDESGSFVLGAGSTKLLSVVNGQAVESTVFVYGSYAMLNDSLLTSSVLGNRTVVLDSLMFGKQKTAIMDIPILTMRDYSINISSQAAKAVTTILLYVVPAGICIVGWMIWFRRKKR